MDTSNPYLDKFIVENLNDIIVYTSHSLEVWNPEYSVSGAVEKKVYMKRYSDKNALSWPLDQQGLVFAPL